MSFVIKKLETSDYNSLEFFCQKCKELGLKNNESFKAIKLDQMTMPYGQYFIAIKNNEIFSLAGIHRFPEMGNSAWRCLFRGAQLPGHTPQWSMDIFKSGIHFSYFLYEQIKFVQEYDSQAEFYITTNVNNADAGSSSKLNKIMMPRLAKQGYWSLAAEHVEIYNTLQNVWKINVDLYLEKRKQRNFK